MSLQGKEVQRTQNKPQSMWQKLQFCLKFSLFVFLLLSASTHLRSSVPKFHKWSMTSPLAYSTLQKKPCDCLHLLLTQVQLDKDTWIMAWVVKKVIKLVFWSVLCQSQFVFSLPPSGHGAMFHCSLLSLPLKAPVGACCWRCLWGCPVPTGSRPPCCPPPRESCGPGSEGPAGEPSSQSRSSTLWPSPRRRAQTAESCPRPATEKPVRRVSLGVRVIQHRSYWRGDITNLQPRPRGLFRNHENWVGVGVSHLVRPEEVWLLKDWSKLLQPLQVEFLRKRETWREVGNQNVRTETGSFVLLSHALYPSFKQVLLNTFKKPLYIR